MIIIRKVAELLDFVELQKNKECCGTLPTMGALHAGHLSLVERAVKENPCVIASVFVNPTQFNNPTDLATYPRKGGRRFQDACRGGSIGNFAPSRRGDVSRG